MDIVLSIEEMEIDAMQNKLMTKAEAIEAHAMTQVNSMQEYWGETVAKSKLFVEGLEALGLIKFKEEYASSAEMAVREKFRQALADAGHPEATVYGHWALSAYDIAHK